jgi:C1A family cysteine protease
MDTKRRGLGWRPDLPDSRDFRLTIAPQEVKAAPKTINMAGMMPAIRDQGNLGSCTGFAARNVIGYTQRRQHRKALFDPSPLFIYFEERRLEGTVDSDAGATIRSAIKVANASGAAPEEVWPYRVERFQDRPPQEVYDAAAVHQALRYERVGRNLGQLKAVLARRVPIILGIGVYDSFFSPSVEKTGVVPMPRPGEALLGGHAVVVQGYDDPRRRFYMRNSWGPDWGAAGSFWLPYDYLLDPDLSDDFWAITAME